MLFYCSLSRMLCLILYFFFSVLFLCIYSVKKFGLNDACYAFLFHPEMGLHLRNIFRKKRKGNQEKLLKC